jgi:hypothetical protein
VAERICSLRTSVKANVLGPCLGKQWTEAKRSEATVASDVTFSMAGHSVAEILSMRRALLPSTMASIVSQCSQNMSVSYPTHPLKIVRGRGQFLYDDAGVEFLDCVNNVCHGKRPSTTPLKSCPFTRRTNPHVASRPLPP